MACSPSLSLPLSPPVPLRVTFLLPCAPVCNCPARVLQGTSDPNQQVYWLLGVDMTTGVPALQLAGFPGWSLGYYYTPGENGDVEPLERLA